MLSDGPDGRQLLAAASAFVAHNVENFRRPLVFDLVRAFRLGRLSVRDVKGPRHLRKDHFIELRLELEANLAVAQPLAAKKRG